MPYYHLCKARDFLATSAATPKGDVRIDQRARDADVEADEIWPAEDVVAAHCHSNVRRQHVLQTPNNRCCQRGVALRAQKDGVVQDAPTSAQV